MSHEPRLAILTIQSEHSWYCCLVVALVQNGLVAGNELSTGEWFQLPAENCILSYDPSSEVVA
jgi:hypothetical protein